MKVKAILFTIYLVIISLVISFCVTSYIVSPTKVKYIAQNNNVNSQMYALNQLAINKINDLISTNQWSHVNSDGCNLTCRTNMLNINGWTGENLYFGTSCDIRNAITLWEQSPSHFKVLNHQYDYGTIQIYRKDSDHCYIVFNVNLI